MISLDKIFSEAERQGLKISLDTNADPLDRYEYVGEILDHVDIFLPNDREAKKITRSANLKEALQRLSSKVPVVAIKRGEKGAIGKCGRRIVKAEPIRINPVDTTGAGDSFDAGFLYYFMHRRKDFETSMSFANALGALSCLYIGGAEERITENDVLDFMNRHS